MHTLTIEDDFEISTSQCGTEARQADPSRNILLHLMKFIRIENFRSFHGSFVEKFWKKV